MNSITFRLLIIGTLALMSACAPYRHAYYPTGGGYTSSYAVPQSSYYGSYPTYRSNTYRYPSTNNYYYYNHDDDHHHGHYKPYKNNGYKPRPGNNYPRPNATNDYSHYHPDRKHRQPIYQDAAPGYPRHKEHQNFQGHRDWGNHQYERRGHGDSQIGRPNEAPQNYGQNRRPDDRRNNIREPDRNKWNSKNQAGDNRRYGRDNNERSRFGNREYAQD